ncbi:sigma-70 family RNA polymerase sigma factor [soil metagenome]
MNPDVELIARSIARDERAFGDLFDRHSKAVFRFAYSLTHNQTEAQELVQDTFVTAWKKLADIRLAGDSMLPWLIVTTRHHAENARRARIVRQALPLEEHILDSRADLLSTERSAHREELDWVFSAVRQLDETDQQIVQLCLYEGISYNAAAKRLGSTPAAIGKRVQRTRTRLRGMREEEWGGTP